MWTKLLAFAGPFKMYIGVAVLSIALTYHVLSVHNAYKDGVAHQVAEDAKAAAKQSGSIATAAKTENAALDTKYNALDAALNKYTVTYDSLKTTLPDCANASADLVRLVNTQHKANPGKL